MVILSDPSLNNCLPLSFTYLQSVSQSVTVSVRDWRSGVIVTWTIKWCDVLDLLFELVYLRTFSQGEIGSNVWKTIFLILDIKSKKKVQIVECVREEKSGGGLRHQIYRRCTSVWCTCILLSTCILSKCYFCTLSSTWKLSTLSFTCILSTWHFCILSKHYLLNLLKIWIITGHTFAQMTFLHTFVHLHTLKCHFCILSKHYMLNLLKIWIITG